jgi:hypothetical protein
MVNLSKLMIRVWFYTENVINIHTSEFWTHMSVIIIVLMSVIYDTHEYDYDTLECDLYTQSTIATRSMFWTRMNVITTRTSMISTLTRVVSTRRVRFPHAERDFINRLCFTHTSVISTLMSVIMTLTSTITARSSVICTRTSVICTRTSWISTRCKWF